MYWSDVSWTPSSRTLRQFAGVWLVSFTGLACWQGLGRDRLGLAIFLACLAGSIGLVGLAKPPAIRLPYVGSLILAFPLGWAISHILLAFLYYGIFMPLGLAFKLMGRDVLCRRFRADQTSYWAPKPEPADLRSYFRQF